MALSRFPALALSGFRSGENVLVIGPLGCEHVVFVTIRRNAPGPASAEGRCVDRRVRNVNRMWENTLSSRCLHTAQALGQSFCLGVAAVVIVGTWQRMSPASHAAEKTG